jgi:agmatine deiminase
MLYSYVSRPRQGSKKTTFPLTSLLLIVFAGLFLLNPVHGSNAKLLDVPVNPRTIAEYDTVAGVVMYWNPGNNQNYDQIVTAVVNGIQPRATVYMQTNGDYHQQNMISTFMSHGVPILNIEFIPVDGYRIWIRDHGPFSIYDDDELAFIGFNDLATNHGDQDLPQRLAEHWDINYYDFMHIIFDGGNYMVDKHNRLFATDRLYSNNPGIPPNHIDTILESYMGIDTIFTFSALSSDYWGHLDMQIKLLNDTTFIISTVDTWHADYQILQNNLAALQAIEHPEGKEYTIVQIPKAQNWKTYINSLIVNDAVLVPVYNDPRDDFALQTYADLMPDKVIIGINSNAMIGWEGAIHCITNQIPPFQAVDVTDHYSVHFNVTDEDGNEIHEAVITVGTIENVAGDYAFHNIESGEYQFTVSLPCYSDYSGEISVIDTDLVMDITLSGITGDANGDGIVNVLDLISVVHYFTDQQTGLFCFDNADINHDGLINVIDAIGIIGIFSNEIR